MPIFKDLMYLKTLNSELFLSGFWIILLIVLIFGWRGGMFFLISFFMSHFGLYVLKYMSDLF